MSPELTTAVPDTLNLLEGFRDTLILFGSIEKLKVKRVSAIENWFEESRECEFGQFITDFNSDVSLYN